MDSLIKKEAGKLAKERNEESGFPFERNAYRINLTKGEGTGRLKIALVTDLHDRPGGRVVEALRECEPDMIAVAGDLMECMRPDDLERMLRDMEEQNREQPAWKRAVYRGLVRMDLLAGRLTGAANDVRQNEEALAFLEGAAKIAPTFYALGNHDRYLNERERAAVEETGTVVLDNRIVRAQIGEWEVAVGGLCSRQGAEVGRRLSEAEPRGDCPRFARVLLCHQPEYYERYLRGLPLEAVLSGHAHGGQWRLFGVPFFAPGQGLFPKYTSGIYENRLVVSRGLSNTAHVPRLQNPMELPIVEIWS